MARAQFFTAERSLQIEQAAIVGASVDADGDLFMETRAGGSLSIGNIKGPQGPAGDTQAAKDYSDARLLDARHISLSQTLMSGGGVRGVSTTGISWSQRLIMMGMGRSRLATSGFFDITMPPEGTVIPINGSANSVVVTNGVIPLSSWRALFYEVPLNQNSASKSANFHVIDYNILTDPIPDNWVLVCLRNNDSMSPTYIWGDGRQQDYWKNLGLQNGWVANGNNWPAAQWRFEDSGAVRLRGLIKSGSVGTTVPFTTFNADLAPEGTSGAGEMFITAAAGGGARVDAYNDGKICIVAFVGNGTNAYVSLAGIVWYPKGS